MKITIGHHPDLPFPFSNAPEPPIPPPRGLPFPPMTLAYDLERGAHWLAELLDYWVSRSGRSTRQMASIANWGLGERSPLESSIINRVKNRKLSASLQALVGMEACNRAIWLWHTEGQGGAWAQLGPHTAWHIKPEWLTESIWLPVPEDEQRPDEEPYLVLHHFVDVLVGRLELPYLGSRLLLPGSQALSSEHLPALLDRVITSAGLGPMDGVRRLLAAYPAADDDRRERFRGVLLGEVQLTPDELKEELLAIAEAIRVLRGLPLGEYGPDDLRTELLAMG
jgi:hypothetical protein